MVNTPVLGTDTYTFIFDVAQKAFPQKTRKFFRNFNKTLVSKCSFSIQLIEFKRRMENFGVKSPMLKIVCNFQWFLESICKILAYFHGKLTFSFDQPVFSLELWFLKGWDLIVAPSCVFFLCKNSRVLSIPVIECCDLIWIFITTSSSSILCIIRLSPKESYNSFLCFLLLWILNQEHSSSLICHVSFLTWPTNFKSIISP